MVFVFEVYGHCSRCGDNELLDSEFLCSSCEAEVSDEAMMPVMNQEEMTEYAQKFTGMLLSAFSGCKAFNATVNMGEVKKGYNTVVMSFSFLMESSRDDGKFGQKVAE